MVALVVDHLSFIELQESNIGKGRLPPIFIIHGLQEWSSDSKEEIEIV